MKSEKTCTAKFASVTFELPRGLVANIKYRGFVRVSYQNEYELSVLMAELRTDYPDAVII
jgi:hypothetical protein